MDGLREVLLQLPPLLDLIIPAVQFGDAFPYLRRVVERFLRGFQIPQRGLNLYIKEAHVLDAAVHDDLGNTHPEARQQHIEELPQASIKCILFFLYDITIICLSL